MHGRKLTEFQATFSNSVQTYESAGAGAGIYAPAKDEFHLNSELINDGVTRSASKIDNHRQLEM